MMTTDRSTQPTEIRKQPGELQVTWADGHVGRYGYRYLRANCQCAACVDEWTRKVMVKIDQIPPDIAPTAIQPVGRYAVHIDWSDGHATGIYAFQLLRRLCPCHVCRPQGAPLIADWV